MSKSMKTPFATAIGAAVLASAAMSTSVVAAENPFAAQELSSGYNLADNHAEGKCGEGKCGDKAKKDGKCGEGKCGDHKKAKKDGKCGEGKCGDKAKKDGKCGEGKCGGEKAKKDGKCGEGKCGGTA